LSNRDFISSLQGQDFLEKFKLEVNLDDLANHLNLKIIAAFKKSKKFTF
jgi:hypothetical protein